MVQLELDDKICITLVITNSSSAQDINHDYPMHKSLAKLNCVKMGVSTRTVEM
jgi:hypothetical protein